MRGMPVAGEVEGDDTQPGELRRQAREAHGVVQPAMQGDHRLAVRRTEQMRGQFDVRQADAYFLDLQAHAERSSVARDQRSNTPFSSSAVSRALQREHVAAGQRHELAARHRPDQPGVVRQHHLLCRPRTIASGTCNCRARPGLLCGTLR